jgi:hypothetical protein
MESKSLLRVTLVSALGQVAWWIGWYGPEHPYAILLAIAGTGGAIGLAAWLYSRWQSRGYKRMSTPEKIPPKVGTAPSSGQPAARANTGAASRG